jgi:formylglycine-generating enzyme required for sulfatase activity
MIRKLYLLVVLFCLALPVTARDREALQRQLALVQPEAVRFALEDMATRWPQVCGKTDRTWCATLGQQRDALVKRIREDDTSAVAEAEALLRQVRSALLANPLLDGDRLLFVRRTTNNLGLPQNWQQLRDLNHRGLTNEIAVLSALRGEPMTRMLHQSAPGIYAGDLQLHWDARRLMFTGQNAKGVHRVYTLDIDSPAQITELPLIPDDDVDNYTGCWLADDSVLFISNASFIGVPCVVGSSYVGSLYRWYPTDGHIRRLTFDQDHNWCPTQLADGRVMYLRWEYSDIAHYVSRILFTMNPDGTGQRELYGSGSYWPNAMFYARPIPDDPHRFAAIVTGHHGVPRMGELTIFDPSRGRKEAQGAIQRIPGRGQPVQAVYKDELVNDSWPKFLHPWPLGGAYFLAACKPDAKALWGLYLVDAFDNLTLIREESGFALFEPVPLQKQCRPIQISDQVATNSKTSHVKITDIYSGPGLTGVPRGTVKNLRIFTYSFGYRGMGAEQDRVGLDGPWDVKRVLGTVPVEADGSVYFEVPANTPVAFHPLDEKGRALQLMRSWITVMPDELQSCSGCHEPQNSGSGPQNRLQALERTPSKIKPWYGPERGFSFNREMQPVLEHACVRCHDGTAGRPDFRCKPDVLIRTKEVYYVGSSHFPPAYLALRAFVRGHTQEGDLQLPYPCDYHASTTELVQLLESGHHGVKLDSESWDRITTWIDLNTPAHGTWTEIVGEKRMANVAARRNELQVRYAGPDEKHEIIHASAVFTAPAEPPAPEPVRQEPPTVAGWPFDTATARAKQQALGETRRTFSLGGNVKLSFARIPPGKFVMADGRVAEIKRPLWMSVDEINNEQYARFDPVHDSRMERGEFLQFTVQERGYPLNMPTQPVCRVSCEAAEAFCRFVAKQSGARVRLPDGVEWEWAARAGAATPMFYGLPDADFSSFANLADATFRRMDRFRANMPGAAVPEWRPADTNYNDGFRVSAPVGNFAANAWGLRDVHGNVWEWTADRLPDGRACARGGSWWKRPTHATFAALAVYPPWQRVYDVGFRVLLEE